MSQENIEIVRRLYDAWNRRDEEELVALSDPEAEWVNSPTAVEPGTRRGTNELLAVWRCSGRSCGMGTLRSSESTIVARRSSSWGVFLV